MKAHSQARRMSGISSVMIVMVLAAVLAGGIASPAAASPAGSAWTKLLPQGILDLGAAVAQAIDGEPYEKWRFYTGPHGFHQVRSTPAIGDDGTIYFGSAGRSFVALNPDGSERWSFWVGTGIDGSAAIGSDGTIYFGARDAYLYALNPDGSERWRFHAGAGGQIRRSPAIGHDGTIYFGSSHGQYWNSQFYALNPDGSEKWRFGTDHYAQSSPAIWADGTIYFGSSDNNLYALNPDGSEKWRFEIGGTSNPALGPDGTIYVGSHDHNVYAVNPDGSEKWRFTSGPHGWGSPAIGADGAIYVGSGDGHLYALNPNGLERWRFEGGSSMAGAIPAIGADGTVYAAAHDHTFYAVNPDGSERWRFVTPPGRWLGASPAIGVDGTIYFGADDWSLYALGVHGETPQLADTPWPKYRRDLRQTGAISFHGFTPPPPVLLDPPADGVVDVHPFALQLSAATPDLPFAVYKFRVELLQAGEVVLTLDQTADPSAWDRHAYLSGQPANVTIEELLPQGEYQWRAQASFGGSDFGPWSETASFSFMPTVRWGLHEPIGHVVQKPIFRLRADVEGTGIEAAARTAGTDRYHYRIEVSREVDFSDQVVIFDQSVDNRGWTQEDYASGENAGMLTDYAFPTNVPLYWRARLKPATGDTWSDPTTVRSFRLIAGWSMVPPHRGIRIGRTERIPVMISNPTEFTCDYLMSFDIGMFNLPDVVGTARLIDPSGDVVDEIVVNEGPLEFITEGLAPGRHLFHVEVSTDWASPQAQQITPRNGIVVPAVAIAIKVAIGYVSGMIIEAACRETTKLFLQEDGDFTDEEASIVADVLQDVGLTAAATGAQSRAAAEAVQRELVRRGRTQLAQKLVAKGGRGIPYVGAAMNVLACGQGVWDAVYGSRPRPVGDANERDYYDYLYSEYYEYMLPPGDPGAPVDPPLYRVVTSWDPNEKVGTVGRSGYVMPGEELPYRVLFENETEFEGIETVPAQEVFISDVILSEHVDLERFSFTAAGFGDHQVVFDEGTTTISHDVHLDLPDRNVVVEIRGGLDLETRTIEVSFRGIDPATGELDWEGFLPPNHNPPEGDGYIAFEAAVADDAPSGAVISNGATIVFDVNPPIITNEVSVTVDDVPPVSTVVALEPVQETETFEVRVDAGDDVSGIYQIHLWVCEEEYVEGAMRPAANIVVDDRVFSLRGVYNGEEDPRFEFEGRDGYVYYFYTVASDVAGNRELPPTTAQASTRVSLPPSTEHTFPAGIQMVSVPVIPDDADPAQMGFDDGKWARWDPGIGDYVLYDNDPDGYTRFDPAASVPGKGYWAGFAAETAVNVVGEPAPGDEVIVQVPAGWAQIGNPRLRELPWSIVGEGALMVRHNGAEMTLAEAQAAGLCEDFAWAYRHGAGYELVYDHSVLAVGEHDRLNAWEGYWFLAHQPVELVFPSVATVAAAAARPAAERAEGDWSVPFIATLDGGSGAQVALGQSATPRQMQLPPSFGNGVQLSVLRDDRRLGVDLREQGEGPVWTLQAVSGVAGAQVTLQWPDLSEVPHEYRPMLVDITTGKRTYMRTSQGYSFTAGEAGEARRFEVQMSPAGVGALVTTATASAADGGNVAVRVTVSAAATVDAEVLNIAGRQVGTVARGREIDAGSEVLLWDAMSDRGTRLPGGMYLIRVTARTEDGQQTSALAPLQLGR